MALRVNVGCGQTPTAGWRNYDNSLSLRLPRVRVVPDLLRMCGLLDESQYKFIRFAHDSDIEFGDVITGLPLPNECCEVVYSSHMIEHLDAYEVERFLQEAYRLLGPGGVLRIAAPDLERQLTEYSRSGDADAFIASTLLAHPRPRSIRQRLQLMLVGTRHHQWMYDGRSLCGLLRKHGFENVSVVPAGQTRIPDHGALNISERSAESVYVEAEKQRERQPSSRGYTSVPT